MKFSHTFIDRPILASVISILIIIIGTLAYFSLPVSQYPEVAPPTIVVTANYPGASAETISKTVATPLEQEINGVEDMLYMLSQSTADGVMTLTVTFELGTDLDEAQVLVQNRVAIAEPRLPEQVRRMGVTTRKNSPDLMLVINMYSPDDTYDQIYIANYATLQVKDVISRIKGVGNMGMFGASEYSMRIWLNPDVIASMDLSAGEILSALRNQNIQIASGNLNQPPTGNQHAFELSVQTKGRLQEIEEFENIIVKSGKDGRIVRVKDVGRVELGAASYATRGYLGDKKAVALPVFQRPGTNAVETADQIKATMEELSKSFPSGLEYDIAYNPTSFIQESIDEVGHTIFEAVILVIVVILLFLQTWRATIIPILAIPVSLIGTFAVMSALGFSLNNLTLFGLVLAIGIVVDDAIVVVENMELNLSNGMSVREAARKTMSEVGGAVLAIGLVLIAVFIPTTFLEGISGQFYRQFGVTISVATMISVFVSLTLSPAMSALLLKAHKKEDDHSKKSKSRNPFTIFLKWFDRFMENLSSGYGKLVNKLIKYSAAVGVVYLVLMVVTVIEFNRIPTGFIPAQDQGYFIVALQLPPGSSLSRTDETIQKAIDKLLHTEGVVNAIAFAGFDGASFTNASNAATIFTMMADFDKREEMGLSYQDILNNMRQSMASIEEAYVVVIPPPPVRGIGNAGGFRMMVQDRQGRGVEALKDATTELAVAANQDPALANVFSFFNTGTPQLYFDFDRVRAEKLGVPVNEVFNALEIYLGSAFVNDFNYLGRTFRVTAQADAPFRLTPDDILRLKVRNNNGEMVPMGSLGIFKNIAGPSRMPRYNLYPASELVGDVVKGKSSGDAISAMEKLADKVLPEGISYEWTEIAYQQKKMGNTAVIAFSLAVLFVFLLLSAQYESWLLPLAVILIVPMCLLSAMIGVDISGKDNNILTQIGLVVLVGLASKNAILIVEFARQLEDQGRALVEAATEAAKLRLRPILMTSFAFILGVVPLVTATGAGSEMRQALGVAVFSGMLGVTVFGLLFTPVFYVLCRKLATVSKFKKAKKEHLVEA
ncbi:efflux RND transporter permease subunit [Chondrinema litorale]|uniref:efflux RND transporter permease subunit n=1 Tax=Chondrinema litorale TaxID=2994555 RepID=UPI002542B498|nr:multidrug efflux RND transporter permease subunit [Chondrinema litorale]UZR96884.1 multidrug efflux RND transporter permease subunit [Chondrinema litorale]